MKAAWFALAATLALLSAVPSQAQDSPKPAAKEGGATSEGPGGCDSFTWDVSHELGVLGKPAKPITAGSDGRKPVHVDLDQHYVVKLLPQSTVKFAVKPGKPQIEDGAQAGVFSFHTQKAGRYRISITTGHWLDV